MKKLILTVLMLGLWGILRADCDDLTIQDFSDRVNLDDFRDLTDEDFVLSDSVIADTSFDPLCVLTIYYVETVDVKLVERTVEVPCPDPSYGMGCLVIHWGTKKFIEPVLKTTIVGEILIPCREINDNVSLMVRKDKKDWPG